MTSQKDRPSTHKELMTINDFLEIYSISRSKYYSEVKEGMLHVTYLGDSPRIKRVDAEKWMDQIGKY